jgi:hypothetical protein
MGPKTRSMRELLRARPDAGPVSVAAIDPPNGYRESSWTPSTSRT